MKRQAQFFIITTVLVAGGLFAITNTFASSVTTSYDSLLRSHDTAVLRNVADRIEAEWWSTDWRFRTGVVVQERAGKYLTAQTVPVTLDIPRSTLQHSCDGLRVIDDGRRMPWVNTTPCNIETYSSDSTAVARYTMDAGTGQWVNDSTDFGYNGYRGGTVLSEAADPDRVTGRVRGALRFDGDDDIVRIPEPRNIRFTDAVTVTAWLRPTTVSTSQQWLVEQDSDTVTGAIDTGSGDPVFRLNAGGAVTTLQGTTPLSTDTWHHLAMTYNGTHMAIYVDGSPAGVQPKTGDLADTNGFYLGGDEPEGQDYYSGRLDDVRIYNRTLPTPQIAGIARGGIGLDIGVNLTPAERESDLYVYHGNFGADDPGYTAADLQDAGFASPDDRPTVLQVTPTRTRAEIIQKIRGYIAEFNDEIGATLEYQEQPGCDAIVIRSPTTTIGREIC